MVFIFRACGRKLCEAFLMRIAPGIALGLFLYYNG